MRSTLFAVTALLAFPAAAAADLESNLKKSRHLWATVNICDTEKHPDAIGIRASMPGTGVRKQRMFMRFQLQYRNAEGKWAKFSGRGPDSRFQPVGPARFKARQSGWLFPFDPDVGDVYTLRGVVTFQWRRGPRILATVQEVTTPGHGVAIADPEGYSAAACDVKG